MAQARDRRLHWRPRSLQSRQLLAASLGLVAFLALAGFALDSAFVDVAGEGLRERLKSYAYAYAGGTEFARDGSLIAPYVPPDGRFDRQAAACTRRSCCPTTAGAPARPAARSCPKR